MRHKIVLMIALVVFFLVGSRGYATASLSVEHKGMFDLYESNRREGVGNYITKDFMITAYSLFIRDILSETEEKVIFPVFKELVKEMLSSLEVIKEKESNAKVYHTALAYVSVLQKLLEPDSAASDKVAEKVKAELELIDGHAGLAVSAVTGVREDFSQYLPRGKYSKSESLKKYFKAMMYAGKAGLYLKESEATGVTAELANEHTAAALVLTRVINSNERINGLHKNVEGLVDFFVGINDDLGVSAYADKDKGFSPEEARKKILSEAISAKRLPKIVSTSVDKSKLASGVSIGEVTASWKLLGQRYTPDSDAFQNLVYDKVTDYLGKKNPFTMSVVNGKAVRGFPTGLDIMSGLGSKKARSMVEEGGDADYNNYKKQMASVASTLSKAIRGSAPSLSNMNLKMIRTLLLQPENAEGLNAALGTWIMNRHNLILYAKQSYTVSEKSLRMDPNRNRASIEPAKSAYNAMVTNLSQIAGKLSGDDLRKKVLEFSGIVKNARTIAENQAKGKLTKRDVDYLNNIDNLFKALLSDPDAPIAVDIHTDANSGMALETALGYPMVISQNKLRGARFNCYEFKQPMDQRLTDEDWQKMLLEGKRERSLTGDLLRAKKSPMSLVFPGLEKIKDRSILEAMTLSSKFLVIVQLEVKKSSKPPTSDAQRREESSRLREQIKRAQEEVLSSLPGGSFELKQRLENAPILAGLTTVAGLKALAAHPMVVSIEEDRPQQLLPKKEVTHGKP